MGITDDKQTPEKVGYIVGPRLVEFIQSFSDFLEGQGEYGKSNTAKYIVADITSRVDDGKKKYGQYLYTDDGICKFQQTSEELDDAIHYLFSNLVKKVFDGVCDIEVNSFQSNILQLKVEFLRTLLDPEFIESITKESSKHPLKKIIKKDYDEDVVFNVDEFN